MEVFRQELNAFPLRALLDQAAEELGEAGLERVLGKYGVARSDISDSSVWVSVEFVGALLTDIFDELGKETGLMERAALRSVAPRYMGPLYPLLVGFGSPLFVYRQLPRATGRMDKIGAWRMTRSTPGNVQLIWTPRPDAPLVEFTCQMTRAQMGVVPILFSCSPALVEHPACVFRGAPACVYDVRWQEPRSRPQPGLGALLGAGAAAGFTLTSTLSPGHTAVLASLFVAGGWALGKAWTLRQELALRLRDVATHKGALEQMTRRNEERYAELLEAKDVVGRKVEERTRELSVTAQQLAETLHQVQALDRAKTAFFSNVSHELRTPLTLLLGPLSQLADGEEPAGGMARAIEVMRRNGLRLLDLINQLLDLNKIDAGEMKLERAPTDLAELVRSVATRFAAACAQRGLELRLETAELAPLAVDASWIESAFSNLVANGARFAATRLSLRVRSAPNAVVLEVEDDGPGIAPEDLPRVFDRFVQGSAVQARQGGTGLGLAIAREAARLHEGDVSVRSERGKTTVFSLSLPRIPGVLTSSAERTLRSMSERSAPTVLESLPPKQPGPGRMGWEGPEASAPLVVLVENDDEVRELVAGALSTSFRVLCAQNGREGLSLIQEVRPDVVVSDVLMPEMDGFTLCRELRKREDTRATPIVLLTARGGLERMVEGFEAGADDYVTKPFHPRELVARVSVHARLRRMVSEMAHRERLVAAGVLAASLAHQVRNPLTAILGGLPILERRLGPALGARDRDLVHALIDSGERIEALVSDLLDLSRVDRDEATRFRPAERVRASIRLLEARASNAVRIEAELLDTAELEGRPGDVAHVFLNLIDNAVRAADPSGRVQVKTFDRDGTFVFEVGDTGPGIPEGKKETVFAPFFTTRAAGEGTGLGLSIVHQVVMQHGGSVSIGRSQLGGALFSVVLPLAPGLPAPTPP